VSFARKNCDLGLFSWVVVVVAIDVTIEVLRKGCDLCVVFVCRRSCCDRSCERDFATFVLYSCVCVLLLLLRSNLRSRFCAKLVIFCVVVVRACVRVFRFLFNANVAIFVLRLRASRFFQDV
jgi:hypothetical protein